MFQNKKSLIEEWVTHTKTLVKLNLNFIWIWILNVIETFVLTAMLPSVLRTWCVHDDINSHVHSKILPASINSIPM